MNQKLPLLPSGPGGVHNLPLRGNQVSVIHATKYILKLQANDANSIIYDKLVLLC